MKINSMEKHLTSFYMKQVKEFQTLITEISILDFTNTSDNKRTTITYPQFLDSVTNLQFTAFPTEILKNSPALPGDGIIAIIATDGNRKEVQGTPFSSSSAVFGTVFPPNLTRFVPNTLQYPSPWDRCHHLGPANSANILLATYWLFLTQWLHLSCSNPHSMLSQIPGLFKAFYPNIKILLI